MWWMSVLCAITNNNRKEEKSSIYINVGSIFSRFLEGIYRKGQTFWYDAEDTAPSMRNVLSTTNIIDRHQHNVIALALLSLRPWHGTRFLANSQNMFTTIWKAVNNRSASTLKVMSLDPLFILMIKRNWLRGCILRVRSCQSVHALQYKRDPHAVHVARPARWKDAPKRIRHWTLDRMIYVKNIYHQYVIFAVVQGGL